MKKGNKKTEYTTKADIEKLMETQTKILLNAIDAVMEKRLEKIELRLGNKIDNVQTLIDAYVKNQEDFRQEFMIMKEEMKNIKKIIKEKFNLEVSAI
ncbi:MAG TPA: hypothetical protein P5232_01155 [Candidatus Moranbacteria bacterium]|nr:hypothetical protein [Candidatus Moranbacteria bacterium]